MAFRTLKRIIAAMALASLTSLAQAQDRPKVVTVNYALQYFADRLLDGDAEVIFPVPADVDPSFWRPGIADISLVQSADLILLNGAGFATWIDRVSLPRARLVNTTAAVEDQFIVTESLTHSHGDGGEHSHEGLASYTWLDPTLALAQAEAIASAIIARDLAPEAEVTARLEDLRTELADLEARARAMASEVSGVPMIATHPRYQYFARRFDLNITSLEWEAGEAPDSDQMKALRALAEETGATVLIWEAEPPASAMESVAELGLTSIVFAPLAHRPATGTFTDTYDAAITALSGAKLNTNGN